MTDRNRVYYRWVQHRHDPNRFRDICIPVDFTPEQGGFICHHCGEQILPGQEATVMFSEIEKGMLYAMHQCCAEEICDPTTVPPCEVFPLPINGIHQLDARLAGSPTRRVVYTYTVPWSMYGEEGTEYAFVPQAPGFLCHVCDKEIAVGNEAYIIASKDEHGSYYTLCSHGRRSCKPKGPEDVLYPGEDEDAWEI